MRDHETHTIIVASLAYCSKSPRFEFGVGSSVTVDRWVTRLKANACTRVFEDQTLAKKKIGKHFLFLWVNVYSSNLFPLYAVA